MTIADQFMESAPTTENYLRGIVLFGRNVASYKFALAESLLDLSTADTEMVSLEELAEPFARHICTHLRDAPRQATASRSRFLDACRQYNEGDLSFDALRDTTVRLGFNNVIDAFHVVGPGEIATRFFIDERREATRGIRLTDPIKEIAADSAQALAEVEARWKLVETAWDLEINRSLIAYDGSSGLLVPTTRRKPLASARDALNGYQKGRCFYCYRPVGTTSAAIDLADVDHVFPHVLQRLGLMRGLDQVWNLVLACVECNRGSKGKFDVTPDKAYITRLHRRNEYLIGSHHPLRESLIQQTGGSRALRHNFLQERLDLASSVHAGSWSTPALADPTF